MGGSGSGRLSMRDTVQGCLILDGYSLLAAGYARIDDNFSKTGILEWRNDGRMIAQMRYQMNNANITLDYLFNNERVQSLIDLTFTKQPNGGERYWYICPGWGCARRVAKLYLPYGLKTFACRKCYSLTYESCNESHKYDGLAAIIARNTGIPSERTKGILNLLSKG